MAPDWFFPQNAPFVITTKRPLEFFYQLLVFVGSWESGKVLESKDQTSVLKVFHSQGTSNSQRTNHAFGDILIFVSSLQIGERNPLPSCYSLTAAGLAFPIVVHGQLLKQYRRLQLFSVMKSDQALRDTVYLRQSSIEFRACGVEERIFGTPIFEVKLDILGEDL